MGKNEECKHGNKRLMAQGCAYCVQQFMEGGWLLRALGDIDASHLAALLLSQYPNVSTLKAAAKRAHEGSESSTEG